MFKDFFRLPLMVFTSFLKKEVESPKVGKRVELLAAFEGRKVPDFKHKNIQSRGSRVRRGFRRRR